MTTILAFDAPGVVEFVSLPVIILIGILFVPFIFQLLWNDTMPRIFNLPRISFWESFRLLLMASILFGNSWLKIS